MKKFIIVTDSCCDLDAKLRAEYDIEYIPMHFSFDGKDFDADLDWRKISVKEFYDVMRSGTRIITAQVSAREYKERFTKYLNEGFDILSISCSSALSASVKASYVAKEELVAEHPERKIVCIDSLISCGGLAMICVKAAQLRAEGKSIDEVAEWIEANKLCFNQEATVDKLVYLRQAGRISASSAFFGGLLSVKPLIISDINGQNVSIEKVKGRKTSITRLAERIKDSYSGTEFKEIFVYHADCEEEAEEFKSQIAKTLGIDESLIMIGGIGPILGASCGPGMMGAYFFGKKVDFDGSAK